jgi:hypothetical protein
MSQSPANLGSHIRSDHKYPIDQLQQAHLSSRLSLLRLLDQACNGSGQLRAVVLPVSQAVLGDTQRFAFGRDRVVETHALNEAAITAATRIGCNDVVKRALLGAATSQADDNHAEILENRGSELPKHAIIAAKRSLNKHLRRLIKMKRALRRVIRPGIARTDAAHSQFSKTSRSKREVSFWGDKF